jgi:hypothetical protein
MDQENCGLSIGDAADRGAEANCRSRPKDYYA